MNSEEMVKAIIDTIGDNSNRPGVEDTPKRVVKSWRELYGGYQMKPAEILSTTFEKGKYNQMVLLKDIEFYSTCEHHMLPFIGKAHVAYIPGTRVVGLSKLARLVECFSRRLQIQEQLTQDIVESLVAHLRPVGAACMIEAQHFCMVARGVKKNQALMRTSHLHGAFMEDASCRSEFFSMLS